MRFDADEALHVAQCFECKVQKISRTTSGVQHAELAQAQLEGFIDRFHFLAGFFAFALGGFFVSNDLGLDLRPLGQQGLVDQWRDDFLDGFGVGVIGAELRAFV